MYAGSANNGAARPEPVALPDISRRLIEPVLALRRRRRGVPEQGSEEGAAGSVPIGTAHPAKARSPATSVSTSDGASSPYVIARQQWSERYGDYFQQAQHWRLLATLVGLIALIALAGMGYIATRSKVIPYLVDMSRFGEVAPVEPRDRAGTVDAPILRAYLARWVTDWRSVTVDRQAQKAAIDRVYAMLPRGSSALRKLSDHFRTNNPFVLAASESVNVSVNSLLPISEQLWQVEWTEIRRDPQGAIQSKAHLKAAIAVGITPPTQDSLALLNPLGIYITDLNWSTLSH
jgi:type IV secretory pathway TrbF-like protein